MIIDDHARSFLNHAEIRKEAQIREINIIFRIAEKSIVITSNLIFDYMVNYIKSEKRRFPELFPNYFPNSTSFNVTYSSARMILYDQAKNKRARFPFHGQITDSYRRLAQI